MNIILSGAYVQGDLQVEFGKLPPAFLPVGLARLFISQIEFFKFHFPSEPLYLSLPEDFNVPSHDLQTLEEFDVIILRTDSNRSLELAIVACWENQSHCQKEPLRLLHGDTLFLGKDSVTDDVVTVHTNHALYTRARVISYDLPAFETQYCSPGSEVLSGYFAFSSGQEFIETLKTTKEIAIALGEYSQNITKLAIVSRWTWLDFGHVNTYFRSKSRFTTERSFNSLVIADGVVTKSSTSNREKILAEASWFARLPRRLALYLPALLSEVEELIDNNSSEYSLELLQAPTLAEIALFAIDNHVQWRDIWIALRRLLSDFKKAATFYSISPSEVDGLSYLYKEKTEQRLQEMTRMGFDLDKKRCCNGSQRAYSLREMVDLCYMQIKSPDIDDVAVMHGDLCFSNIFYDTRTSRIKVIDPRGYSQSGMIGCLGDSRYDLAKLYHSVAGRYDEIIAGQYYIESNEKFVNITFMKSEDDRSAMLNSFEEIILGSDSKLKLQVLSITVLLFITMIPLHADRRDRQEGFIANSYRLFALIEDYSI